MVTLRDKLSTLAADFAASVFSAIRGASLEDLLAESSVARGGRSARPRGRTKATATAPRASAATATRAAAPVAASAPKGRAKGGRLPRRSPAEVDKTLGLVVAALKSTKAKGMRSEEIQKHLKLDKRELPRVLKTGLQKKALRSKGQKRSTVYFVA
jgi:hypothetical protein